MQYIKFQILILFICCATCTFAQKISQQTTAIKPGPFATHVVKITNDTLIMVTGSTYLFTVDTPEDKGLVSTNATVTQLLNQITARNNNLQKYQLIDKVGKIKTEGQVSTTDLLKVTALSDQTVKTYVIRQTSMAVGGSLSLKNGHVTANSRTDLVLYFSAGQRSPDATVSFFFPPGIDVNLDNTSVNVIGRGTVKLKDLERQSIGRTGSNYSYNKVGEVKIVPATNGGSIVVFSKLDLRPANGADLVVTIHDTNLSKPGLYPIRASYTTSKPEILSSAGMGAESVSLNVSQQIADFTRIPDQGFSYDQKDKTATSFSWGINANIRDLSLWQSTDAGKSWQAAAASFDFKKARASIAGLTKNQLYRFKLLVRKGPHQGYSNEVQYYTGNIDIKSFGKSGEGKTDDTNLINKAIAAVNQMGGGTLFFSKGTYLARTVHLKSNVHLFLDKDAVIQAIKGSDAPEATWFSDKQYRSGLSPTDAGPYADPENYLTKQDVGHHYFRNALFFGERLDNIKITGNGLITGNGVLVNSDKVMNNAADQRADKMFSLKLCTNVEIGGIYRAEDLWYDPIKDKPYYIGPTGEQLFDDSNMLKIERAGHFVLLATGTDGIYVHNTYFGKGNSSNARDIYDFMACNDVTVTNIYSKVSSDDIVKPGSDCSLGFTRPAGNYKIRNIIGDTNCNLFQIGSETADDIKNICVDNIYVLGANKAGFSISTNDGADISDIHLNCGHTGSLHSRSKMLRTRAPFFISISNRGRILGANVGRYIFTENGVKHDELLVKNVNIGKVENIILNGIDISEVYSGSSYGAKNDRWKAYDGTQEKATPIVAGYALPPSETVTGGLNFRLPNGEHTGYIKNIEFNDVHVLVKGGNPATDTTNLAPELGVGQYNVANLKTQPSYGLWARHVKNLSVKGCSFSYESRDSRYAIFLDDVIGANLKNIKLVRARDNKIWLATKQTKNIFTGEITLFEDTWNNKISE